MYLLWRIPKSENQIYLKYIWIIGEKIVKICHVIYHRYTDPMCCYVPLKFRVFHGLSNCCKLFGGHYGQENSKQTKKLFFWEKKNVAHQPFWKYVIILTIWSVSISNLSVCLYAQRERGGGKEGGRERGLCPWYGCSLWVLLYWKRNKV